MSDYLIKHAVDNVWCHPDQDDQVIIAPRRISKPSGVIGSAMVMTRRIQLPEANKIYHLFQVGQVLPEVVGLLNIRPTWSLAGWERFNTALNVNPLYCDIYTDAGVQMSLFTTYYQYTSERALIIAIEETSKLPIDFKTEQIYIRLYTNAFFESPEASTYTKLTVSDGKVMQNSSQILAMQSDVIHFSGMPGATMSFVNGNLVKDISPFSAKIGDHAEYVYDASIKRIVDIPVSSLNSFQSDLDDMRKYLIHFPDTKENVIDYLDDVDVYIVAKTGILEHGRYYHRNVVEAMRMVTHRDYSLSVDSVRNIGLHLLEDLGLDAGEYANLYIRLYIRKSGLMRPLVYERNRIFEMYKMKDADVLDAMIGTVVRLPIWRAEELENCAYTSLMRAKFEDITRDVVEGAYGYSAISKILADGPIKTIVLTGSTQVARLPIGVHAMSTMYEYDENGVLLEMHLHPGGTIYYPKNAATRMVEAVVGTASQENLAYFGDDDLPADPVYSYRVYVCYKASGVPSRQWVDITGTDQYRVENNRILWNGHETEQYLMVRTDQNFLAYEMDQTFNLGTLSFDLTEVVDGQPMSLSVPPGDLDIWINKRSAILGLDYLVDFPTVHIVNKNLLVQPTDTVPQNIVIRGRGFCRPDLTMEAKRDFGYIVHDTMSNNSKFDLRDDKVLRIISAGRLKHRSDVKFSEDTTGVSIIDVDNGAPYQVKKVTVPLRGHTDQDTYRMREESCAIDEAVSAYLSTKIPQPSRPAVSAIQDRWPVFSPFFSAILHALVANHIDPERLKESLDRNDVEEICQSYLHLLSNDPLNGDLDYDSNFVVIHASALNRVIRLDLYKYRFLQRVVAYYGRGLVNIDLSASISLSA